MPLKAFSSAKGLAAVLLSTALCLSLSPVAEAATAAAAARINARTEEAAAEKAKTQKASPTSKGKAGASGKSKSATAEKTTKPGAKKSSGKETKTAEKSSPSKSSKTAAADKTKADRTKAEGAKKAAAADKPDKALATASERGTPYVTPGKADKYANRKDEGLSIKGKGATKPKPVVQAEKKPAPSTPSSPKPSSSKPSSSKPSLAADADKAVTDLLGPVKTPAVRAEAKPEPAPQLPTSPLPYLTTAAGSPKESALQPTATTPGSVAEVPPSSLPSLDSPPLAAAESTSHADRSPSEARQSDVSPPDLSGSHPTPASTVVATHSLPDLSQPSPDAHSTSVTPPQTFTPAPIRAEALPRTETPPRTEAPKSLASVTVDAYARDYEGQKTGAEIRYDSGIRSGLVARQSKAGDLEGNWLITSLSGERLVSLALRGGGAQIDGAWRSLQGGMGLNRSGLIDNASQSEDRLTLDYRGADKGRYRIDLRREPDGRWRGQIIDPAGAATPVVMQSQ